MTANEGGDGQVTDLDLAIALAEVRTQMRAFREGLVNRQTKAATIIHMNSEESQ